MIITATLHYVHSVLHIWNDLNISRNLDGAMTTRLKEVGIYPVSEANMPYVDLDNQLYGAGHLGYNLKEIEGFAIDIKTKTKRILTLRL